MQLRGAKYAGYFGLVRSDAMRFDSGYTNLFDTFESVSLSR